MKTKLSVNVNKIATLRNARGKDRPNVVAVSEDILRFGAHGITVHPRPDGRHIRHQDVIDLAQMLKAWQKKSVPAEFNIEGYPDDGFLKLIEGVLPDQCTLVPDPPDALTSNAGWDVVAREDLLTGVIRQLQSKGVRVSLFVDPEGWSDAQTAALKRIRPNRIELYTEKYAETHGTSLGARVLETYVRLARQAQAEQIGVNAGHDLDQKNVGDLATAIPQLAEVSIGHALVSEALYDGLHETVVRYLRILNWR